MFGSVNVIAIVVFLAVIDEVLLKQIPDYIQKCKRDQNTINSCVKNAVDNLRPFLKSGMPELEVPSIEPFNIKEIKPPVGDQLRAVGRDIKVSGGSNYTIKSVVVDLDTMTIRARIRFPKLHLEGRYKVNTRILVLPIEGQGTMVADAVKCDAEMLVKSQIEERDGKEYIKFTKMVTDISVKDYRIRLEGLFNGDKTLGEATNAAINQNRGEFLAVTKPYLERAVSEIMLDVANKIADGVVLDDFFLS